MDTTEMLNRIKTRDFRAYCQLTEDYGWKLYSRIRDRVEDGEKANAAFHETLSSFRGDLTDNDGDDAIEALLFAYAEKVCSRMEHPSGELAESPRSDSETPTEVLRSGREKKAAKRTRQPGGFWFGLCIVLLFMGMMAALWVILGLLMDMNFIPELDLGYSWFNMYIAPWF